MIKISSLNKIYNKDTPNKVEALKDVNLVLPNNGMVFVVGKSGSGKSTLLNLLGGLDRSTSGDIIVDDYNLSKLDENDLEKYRDSYLGFIFQDFCLVDTLRVFDNIKLSLSIQNNHDVEKIDEVLQQVELLEYKNRFPRQLSAGQKQRVAIARAIIKKPRLILCDEPTGNLDSKTGKQILDILKELSKTALVVIVSHNLDDAYDYADRIIEIKDGQVDSDIVNLEGGDYLIKDNSLYLSNVSGLDENKIKDINKEIKEGHVKEIKRKKDLFQVNKEDEYKPQEYKLEKHKFSFKETIKLSLKLIRRKWLPLAITSLMIGLLTSVFGLCQQYTSFSSDKIIEQALSSNSQRAFVMQKAVYTGREKRDITKSVLISIDDSDKELIKNSSYNDEYYSLYNYSLPVSLRYWQLANEMNISNAANLVNFYLQEIYGVLPCDSAFVEQVFPNSLTDYVGNLNDKDYGIIITDYVADSILHFRGEKYSSYNDILGYYANKGDSTYGYINAIIKTDYKTKHAKVIETYQKYDNDPNSVDVDAFVRSDEYISFIEEAKGYLGIAYSFNKDFMTAAQSKEARNIVRIDNSYFGVEVNGEKKVLELGSGWGYVDSAVTMSDLTILDLPDNTIAVSLSQFNNMLHTTLNLEQAKALVNKITLAKTHRYTADQTPLFEREVNVEIYDTGMFSFAFSEDLFTFLRQYDMIPYALYFKDISKANEIYHLLRDVPFVANSSYIDAGISINNAVNVFSNFFVLITSILLTILLIALVVFSYVTIREQKYNIGVLKSLGMRNVDVSKLFITHIAFVGIISSALFTISLLIFTKVSNNLLVDSFVNMMKNPAIAHINIIYYHPWVFIVDIAIIFGISVLTALIPLLTMKRYKPIEIIRKSDN